jgi:hypothetical protein
VTVPRCQRGIPLFEILWRRRYDPRAEVIRQKGILPVPTEVKEIEELRTKHQVRLVTDEEEGTGIDRLPKGVYGFTYSPAADNFPLFKKQEINAYESHKLPDGTALLIGYLTPREADTLETTKQSALLHLFPNAKNEAATLVTIPMTRVQSHKENSQRSGTGLEIHVGPSR